ncbi:MAG: aldo/keto reductase [Ruminococcaceae bacterium]|nr:aldo/keto reductase [Oscillospiraceae bacterium]
MKKVVLGKTGITTIQNAFGALPIQRVSDEYAVKLLRRAYEGGFTFFDTARAYSDSERKIGLAFSDMRDKITIASKTMSVTPEGIKRDLEASLKFLNTDYIDIYQVHNPAFCPKLNDGTGVYETLLEAKKEGKIRHIGLTNHRLHIAREAVESGLYETLQFPFCYLATDKEIELVKLCKEHNVGFIAMKALSGGLITNSAAAYAYISQFDNVLPIWGIQRDSELEEFISYISDTPEMNAKMTEMIEKDRKELLGDFCRGCGYCMPCPVGIEINNSARMSQLIRRSPSQNWLTPEWQEKMLKIESCLNCNKCASQCPYGLDTPALLRRNLEDYKNIISGKTKI